MNQGKLSVEVVTEDNSNKENFLKDVISGLQSQPKKLQSKYFYDKNGDALFQQIMASPEYYLTNCELEIFQHNSPQLASKISTDTSPFDLIELGAGDATKSQYLLKYLVDKNTNFTYIPIDISGHILQELEARLNAEIPALKIKPQPGDYFEMLEKVKASSERRKVVMFLGSNIGNMEVEEAEEFCKLLRAYLNAGDQVLMGFDLQKHPRIILDAYTDKAGITSQFNLNLLARINRELDGKFNLNQFEHFQTYDPGTGACKSYLISLCDQEISIGNNTISFSQNESIYMEISQKYSEEAIIELGKQAGFLTEFNCFDSKGWFIDTIWKAV